MKKLLSLLLAGAMMLSTAVVSFASADLKVPANEALKPKIWAEYASTANGIHTFNVYYSVDAELSAVEITDMDMETLADLYTGKAIMSLSFQLDATQADYAAAAVTAKNSWSSASKSWNKNLGRIVFTKSWTSPTEYVASAKELCAEVKVKPIDTTIDPEKLVLNFSEALIQIDEYANSATPVNSTEYSNLSSADYPIYATMNSEVLVSDSEAQADGKMIVAHTKNVENVTAATTVTVSYEGTEKEYGDFGSLLGIEGEGTATGTVRFAVRCSDTLDPNGFLFTIN